jgi:6-hydroxynicotinate 3-monooxygenase
VSSIKCVATHRKADIHKLKISEALGHPMRAANHLRIAIIGAGLGGVTCAILFQRSGYHIDVYEQAPVFTRLGAGIHLGPNCVRVFNHIGIGEKLLEFAVLPKAWNSLQWDSGECLFSLPLRDVAEQLYGAAYVTVHRGDMHALLIDAVAPGTIHFGKQLIDLDQDASSVRMLFADGSTGHADIVVGADGVFSKVREWLFGPQEPIYTGYIGHRAFIPARNLGQLSFEDHAKWWAPDRHLIVYFLTNRRDELYLVTGALEKWEKPISWSNSSMQELRAAFVGFHSECQRLIGGVEGEVTKWAFFERAPMPIWHRGRIVMIGDACHPMKPHMAQGAAIAIEDAAMLLRCLKETGNEFSAAFVLYEANRMPRAHKVQELSRYNTWLRDPCDPTWLYGYNVFTEPLVKAREPARFLGVK